MLIALFLCDYNEKTKICNIVHCEYKTLFSFTSNRKYYIIEKAVIV